jgi:hypothetical protein
MAESQCQKQTRIKTGVVTRIQKELARYHEELEKNKAVVARLQSTGADEHDIKKQARANGPINLYVVRKFVLPVQIEVQGETEAIIPDTMRRLQMAVEDLRQYVVSLH